MSRHRDIRSMNYSEEYEGYDDIYGHSVDDDYCVSPSDEHFMFDRSKEQNMSSFLAKTNVGEGEKEKDASSMVFRSNKDEKCELESAKLASCIEAVRKIVGDSIPELKLKERILKANFNAEFVVDSILEESSQAEQTTNELESQTGMKASSLLPTKVILAGKRAVKGFNLDDPNNSRSHSPSSGRNSPDVRGISKLNSPANSTTDLDVKIKPNNKGDVLSMYKDRRKNEKEQLNMVVVGHVDAGKSTLLGRLLYELGQVSSKVLHKHQQESKKIGKQSFAYAWILDETEEERARGITMDVGHSKFETDSKSIVILDAPGHRDFIPNMIIGTSQADVALLVVDATRGEFESGFLSGGQTREHALLLRSLGISQVAVVINKLDTVNWSKERFNEIVEKMSVFLKQAGFKDTVSFVPCSGLSGENMIHHPKIESFKNWYTGPSLLEVIEKFECPQRPVEKPFRCSVNDVFKSTGFGFCVSGHVETGMVSIGDKIVIMPRNEIAVIKGLQIDDVSNTNAFAGDHVILTLSGIDQQNVGIGDIVCNIQNPVPITTRFQVHVVIFNIATPITKGLPVVLHQQSLAQPAVITKLIAELQRNTGEIVKKKPRCLSKNTSAVIEITTQTPICVELFKDIKQLGRITLRVAGVTIAAGLVTEIK